jgi:hypothetical protein
MNRHKIRQLKEPARSPDRSWTVTVLQERVLAFDLKLRDSSGIAFSAKCSYGGYNTLPDRGSRLETR